MANLVETDLPRLESNLRQAEGLREEMDQSIMKKTADELAAMKHTLESERRNRQEGDQVIHEMISNVMLKIKQEID